MDLRGVLLRVTDLVPADPVGADHQPPGHVDRQQHHVEHHRDLHGLHHLSDRHK